ncbi:MAG: cell division protein SepF [Clostridia bacterium]|nr:cell division protein SepF [Clostridia bacterium]
MGLFDRFAPRDEDEELDLEEQNEEQKDSVKPASAKPKKQFVLFRPNDPSHEQLFTIADHLMNRESVILNLELIAKDSRHFVDFLSGVAYALQGQTKKIASHTFLFTPGGVEVEGDIAATLEPELKF